jgi:hypothetical protein
VALPEAVVGQEVCQLVLHCVVLLVRSLLLMLLKGVADLGRRRGPRLPRRRGVCAAGSSLVWQQLGKQAVATGSSSRA